MLRRRALLKYIAIGGALALVGNVIPSGSSFDLMTEVYGEYAPAISVRQSNSDAYELITQALAEGQTKIHLPAGIYSCSQQIDIYQPNVEIYGDGSSGSNRTQIRLNDGVGLSGPKAGDVSVFSFYGPGATTNNPNSGADNFNIHDLEIDGNSANNFFQGNPGTPTVMDGIVSWNCNGGLVENCYIHDCRFMGIHVNIGSNCTVQNNTVNNSGANGIAIGNAVNNSQRGRGSGHQVLNNSVNGASDVGISVWEGIGTLVQGNTVQDITMGVSPYQQNTCDGLLFEGTNPCSDVTFSNNTVSNISYPNGALYKGLGIGGGPDGSSNIQFLNNTIENVYSAMRFVSDVTGLVVTGNSVNGTTGTTQPLVTVATNKRGNAPSDADFEQNTLAGMPSDMSSAIVVLVAGSGKFINNTIYANGNVPIRVIPAAATDWITTPNDISNATNTASITNTTTTNTSTSVPEFSDLATVLLSTLAASVYALKRRRR